MCSGSRGSATGNGRHERYVDIVTPEKRGRTVRSVSVAVQSENANGALVSHTLFGDTDDLFVIVAECDSFHRGRELPNVQTFPVRDVPEA